MADNYLERRMEDMRTGRFKTTSSGVSSKPLSRLRAVVTGGARGIGYEIATALLRAGCSVDIIDKSFVEDFSLSGASCHCVDIGESNKFEECLQMIFRQRGDIDIIVNNAVEADFVALEENDAERMLRSLRVNVVPIMVGASLLLKHRRNLPIENPYGGRIINICSTRAYMSEEGTENYSASKGAVLSLTHALMMSMQGVGVTVNSISPGWIETSKEATHTMEDKLQHPSRRVGKMSDIARYCVFLCRRDNEFINGSDLIIDGGMTHKMIYV